MDYRIVSLRTVSGELLESQHVANVFVLHVEPSLCALVQLDSVAWHFHSSMLYSEGSEVRVRRKGKLGEYALWVAVVTKLVQNS